MGRFLVRELTKGLWNYPYDTVLCRCDFTRHNELSGNGHENLPPSLPHYSFVSLLSSH